MNRGHAYLQPFALVVWLMYCSVQSRLQSLIVGIYDRATVRDGYNLKAIYSI